MLHSGTVFMLDIVLRPISAPVLCWGSFIRNNIWFLRVVYSYIFFIFYVESILLL